MYLYILIEFCQDDLNLLFGAGDEDAFNEEEDGVKSKQNMQKWKSVGQANGLITSTLKSLELKGAKREEPNKSRAIKKAESDMAQKIALELAGSNSYYDKTG